MVVGGPGAGGDGGLTVVITELPAAGDRGALAGGLGHGGVGAGFGHGGRGVSLCPAVRACVTCVTVVAEAPGTTAATAPGPHSSPSTTASSDVRLHHCVRDTGPGLSRVSGGDEAFDCPKWYVPRDAARAK